MTEAGAPGAQNPPRVATGIEGLDNILGGGFTPDRLYLIEGDPGSGKTTLALQFLLEGARARRARAVRHALGDHARSSRAVGRVARLVAGRHRPSAS